MGPKWSFPVGRNPLMYLVLRALVDAGDQIGRRHLESCEALDQLVQVRGCGVHSSHVAPPCALGYESRDDIYISISVMFCQLSYKGYQI